MNAPDAPAFDRREFRDALGCFATGVTVVTTRAASGEPIGLTVNSFSSVSLQPPLVLWSLARDAQSLPAFQQAPHWAVHVLAARQEDLSARFAARGTDKFAGLAFDDGIGGQPLLRGCAARFQCRAAFQYDGGDHVIFVGEVVALDRSDAPPLVFHRGRYAVAGQKNARELESGFADDFLVYLLGRSHFHFFRDLKAHLRDAGISDDEHFVLGALMVRDGLGASQLAASLADLLGGDVTATLAGLLARGYVVQQVAADGAQTYQLATAGRDCALHFLAAAKAHEAHVTERFGNDEIASLKHSLRALLSAKPRA
ncbi:MAG TPA: flavin reductase [Solimonas sp.]|nr:flavin reductase [Solimonas sp.]